MQMYSLNNNNYNLKIKLQNKIKFSNESIFKYKK